MRKTAEKLFIAIVALLPVAVLGTKSLAMPRNLAAKTSKSKKNSKSTQKSKDVDDGQCDERTLLLEADGEEVRKRIIDQAFQELEGAEFFDEAFVQEKILDPYKILGIEQPGFSYDDVSSSKAFLENEIAVAVSILGEGEITSSLVEPFYDILDPTMGKEIRMKKMKTMIETFVNEAIDDVDPYGLNSSSEISLQTKAKQMEAVIAESGLTDACANRWVSTITELMFLVWTLFGLPKALAESMGKEIVFLMLVRYGLVYFKRFLKKCFSKVNPLVMAAGLFTLLLDIRNFISFKMIVGVIKGGTQWWQVASYASLLLSNIAIAFASNAVYFTVKVISRLTSLLQVILSIVGPLLSCP